MKDVVILTEDRFERVDVSSPYTVNVALEDGLLEQALTRCGLSVERVSWSRAGYDWQSTRAVVFRSTWDYFDRFPEFSVWLKRVSSCAQVFNPVDVVRWNVDKHYLRDLQQRGSRIVPTHFAPQGDDRTLAAWLADCECDEAVIKPVVSGAARHTYRVTTDAAPQFEGILAECLAARAMMLQPFQRSVLTRGEVSLVMIDGRFSHAVQKLAKPGDFRVQDDHGGTVRLYTPTDAEIACAERAVASCPAPPIYARVDLVDDNAGLPAIMELELIEPELWFRLHPPAAAALAQSVVRRLGRGDAC